MRSVLILAIYFLLAPLAEAKEPNTVLVETWKCYAVTDFGQADVLVLLTRRKQADPEFEFGTVKVAGIQYTSTFGVRGFNRRWNFSNGDTNYSFVIEPDGTGRYYDFSRADDNGVATSSQVYECVMR